MAACEGALLLVDATQGIQAQTMANFYQAFSNGLSIIPVINKVEKFLDFIRQHFINLR
jgi:translation elongation factor EF-4